jgi:hypothetical protein
MLLSGILTVVKKCVTARILDSPVHLWFHWGSLGGFMPNYALRDIRNTMEMLRHDAMLRHENGVYLGDVYMSSIIRLDQEIEKSAQKE